eukprot:gene11580-7976_t
MNRTLSVLFQSGVHVPHGVRYNAAHMKFWPHQKPPLDFHFTAEQKFKAKPFPRDTGKIPKDFVLSVLYRHQPCKLSELWSHCLLDARIVLDSRRHLREVLHQMRLEGFVTFEKNIHNAAEWECHLTRERYEEVRQLVLSSDAKSSEESVPPREPEEDGAEASQEATDVADKLERLKALEKRLAETTKKLQNFQRVEIDYLPYTDLNGKVNFMWWYETMEAPLGNALPQSTSDEPQLAA